MAALRQEAADDGVEVDRLLDARLQAALVDALRDQRAVQDGHERERQEERGDDELAGHAHRKRRAG